MSSPILAPYRVEAYNTAHASENKIHDDAVARRFGFGGGFVPGVDVYAYMTHLPVERWGRAWLDHGTAECRLAKPVYDGDRVTVSAAEDASGLEVRLEARGIVCATGRTALPPPAPLPSLTDFPDLPEPDPRPPADEDSLAVGTRLAIAPFVVTPELAAEYLDNVRETLPLYKTERLVHPVIVLRTCNWVLSRNVVLGPWMHVGSTVRNFAAVRVGEALTARATVTGNYEHKGHRFVEADVLVLAEATKPVAHVRHIAIYRPRQVTAA